METLTPIAIHTKKVPHRLSSLCQETRSTPKRWNSCSWRQSRARRRFDLADLLIVNTCASSSRPAESIDTLLELALKKRTRSEADRHRLPGRALLDELQAELPSIDAFVGARNWSALPRVLTQLEEIRAPGSSSAWSSSRHPASWISRSRAAASMRTQRLRQDQ